MSHQPPPPAYSEYPGSESKVSAPPADSYPASSGAAPSQFYPSNPPASYASAQPGAYQSGYPTQPAGYPGPQGPYPGPQGPYPGPQGPYPGPQGPYPTTQGPYPTTQGHYPNTQGPYQAPQTHNHTTVVNVQPQAQHGPIRNVSFRALPVCVVCPHCHNQVVTRLSYSSGLLAFLLCCALLFVGLGLGCCLIPFCIDGCKDVHHHCPNCNRSLGKFSRI